MSEKPVGVLGAGSFGTALAIHWAAAGHRVVLWARRPELARELAAMRENPLYLPGEELPSGVAPTADLAALAGCDPVVVAIPSQRFRRVARNFLHSPGAGAEPVLVSAAKGVESETLQRMSEVSREEGALAGRRVRFAALSGPCFAAELARGVATASVVAADEEELAKRLQRQLSSPSFRLYSSTDVVGVELGGAAKNVIAIAAGIVTGLGLGHNTLAALITRGLHEITRLGLAAGGDARTFAGLAGLGDLVLTCTGGLSRNRSVGVALGEGKSLEEATAGSPRVAEGVANALALERLAEDRGVDMPIVEQVMAILHQAKPPALALQELMTRALKAEVEF